LSTSEFIKCMPRDRCLRIDCGGVHRKRFHECVTETGQPRTLLLEFHYC